MSYLIIFILLIIGVWFFLIPHPFLVTLALLTTVYAFCFISGMRKHKKIVLAQVRQRQSVRLAEIASTDDGSEPSSGYVNQDPDIPCSTRPA